MRKTSLLWLISLVFLASCSSKQASYDYTQSQIDHQDLRFAETLRVDEYINAFPQDELPSPKVGESLALSIAPLSDRLSDVQNRTLVQVAIKSRGPSSSEKLVKPGICIVLDVSGSMEDDHKLENAKVALKHFVAELNDGTQFALVTFDDKAKLVVPPQKIARVSRKNIETIVEKIESGGGTDIYGGLVEGYRQLSAMQSVGLRRLILITDGMSTVGNATPESLAKEANAHYDQGARISTIGLGNDVDEKVLRRIAEQGSGQYYFADKAEKLTRFLTTDFKTMLFPVAKDVRLTLTPPSGFRVNAVYGFLDKPAGYGEPVKIEFGELNVDDWRIVIAELEANSAADKDKPLSAKLTYEDIAQKHKKELTDKRSFYVNARSITDKGINHTVARNAVIFADAMALKKASQLLFEGKNKEASDVLSVQLANVRVVQQWDKSEAMRDEELRLQKVFRMINQNGAIGNATKVSQTDAGATSSKEFIRVALDLAQKTLPGPWSLLISIFSLFGSK